MLKPILLALCLSICQTCSWADQAQGDNIQIKVQKNGDAVVIDLTVDIPATPQETWAVLVDFDHMTQFLNNLQSSKIVEKNGNKWKVTQKGQSSHGGFSFSFESTREVELSPYETIRSRLISGTMKKFDGLTQLSPSNGGTHIVYHSDSVTNIWVPPLVGTSIVEGEIRKQFQDMEAEILKRKNAAKPAG